MHLLETTQQARWLAERNLPVEPYEKGSYDLEFYLQFHVPKSFRGIEYFTKGVIECAGKGGQLLVTVTDTVMAEPFETRLFERLRTPNMESKRLIDQPAHLFDHEEDEDVIAMFSLTVALEWKAYLHFPASRSVLYNWEGEIFDFWSADYEVFKNLSQLVQAFELKKTK